MKQLLIVNSSETINAGLTEASVKNLSALQEGAITFFELGATTALSAAPRKNFGIALGRPNGQRPFVFPEVDIKTLHIAKALPTPGNPFSVSFTMPTTVVGDEYTLRFFKKGTVPHERNSWTVSIVAGSTTPATEAAAFKKLMDDKQSDDFNFTTTVSTATITITSNDTYDWEVFGYDGLSGESITVTNAVKTIGDKKYIQDLASQCAAGKGFEHTAAEGREFIPGYPEAVEDLVPNTSGDNDASTAGYALYTLRFRVGRDSAKTRDERVWQVVHIAVPVSNASFSTIDGILPEGDYSANLASAIANEEITTMVNSSYLND